MNIEKATAFVTLCVALVPGLVAAQSAPSDAPATQPTATTVTGAQPATTTTTAAPMPATAATTPVSNDGVVPPPPPTPLLPAPMAPPDASNGWLTGLTAGFHNDQFYISNSDATTFIVPTGRLQLDSYVYAGDRITDDYTTGTPAVYHRGDVKDTFVLRRARIEVAGMFLGVFTYFLGADFAQATSPSSTDLIFNARILPWLNFQFGQFDAPFTLENRTSDKYFDFIERSLAVRAFAFPSNKDQGFMLWGETSDRLFFYSIGLFNGDGQNVRDRDNNPDLIGRIFAHPLIHLGGPLANLQIGASIHYGARGASVDYAYPAMTTLTGVTFFNPALSTNAMTPVTVVPDADQLSIAGELDLPIGRFDLRGEYIYLRNDTREMGSLSSNANGLAGNALRLGDITGSGYYAQIGFWLWGAVGVNGRPGYENPVSLNLHRPDPASPPLGLQAVARFDAVDFRYSGGSRSGNTSAVGSAEGRYTIYAAEVGLNFWATRHVRFSVDYIQNFFPNQPPTGMAITADDNHAHGPHLNQDNFGELVGRVGLVL